VLVSVCFSDHGPMKTVWSSRNLKQEQRISCAGPVSFFRMASEVVKQKNERFDGPWSSRALRNSE
jgi:hypothetical protein